MAYTDADLGYTTREAWQMLWHWYTVACKRRDWGQAQVYLGAASVVDGLVVRA